MQAALCTWRGISFLEREDEVLSPAPTPFVMEMKG
jgi:hypothetical protein